MNRESPSTDSLPVSPKTLARWSMVAAALLWSTSGVFARAPIFADWPLEVKGPMLAFWRASFAAMVLAPTIRRPRWRWYLVPLVLSFAAMNATYLTSMSRSTPANAIWLQSAAPFWVFLLSFCLFGERIVRRDLVPLVFGMAGVGTILCFELVQPVGRDSVGLACGVISGIFYAGVLIFMRRLSSENPAWLVALNHAVSALALLPWVLYLDRWPTAGQLAVLAAFGTVQMALPYLLVTHTLRSISPQEAVAIGLIEPILVPLWAWLAWGVTVSWWTVVGAVLIFMGLVLRYVVWDLVAQRGMVSSADSA